VLYNYKLFGQYINFKIDNEYIILQHNKLVVRRKIGDNKEAYVSMIRNQIIKEVVIWRIGKEGIFKCLL